MKKAIWLTFDLGIKGDYDGMYAWLDDQHAKECGDNIAFFNYEISNNEDLLEKLKEDLSSSIEISKRDRIYVIWLKDGKMKGRYIFGKRKASPWVGYGTEDVKIEEDY